MIGIDNAMKIMRESIFATALIENSLHVEIKGMRFVMSGLTVGYMFFINMYYHV